MNILTADFHTHILPGIDDGSPTVGESIKMLQQERAQGIETVFFTPHFTAAKMYPQTFLDKRLQAYNMLLQETGSMDIPACILGTEVSFYTGMSKWEELDQLQLGNTGYILIEMPVARWQKSTFEELENIYFERDLIPVIAHIERYINPFNTNKLLDILSGLPVLLQSNCSFINDRRTQRKAISLLKNQQIQLIATDCHTSTWRQPCMLDTRNVISTQLGEETVAYLSQIENTILSGKKCF